MAATFDRLSAILMRDYPVTAPSLQPDAALDSLGIDSLGTVELLWTIEEEFSIKLPAEPVELATLGDVVRYIDEIVAQQAGGVAGAPSPVAPDPTVSPERSEALVSSASPPVASPPVERHR